jgi:hypothetical protein
MPPIRTLWVVIAAPIFVVAFACGTGDGSRATPNAIPSLDGGNADVDGGGPNVDDGGADHDASPACDQRWQPAGTDVTKSGVVGDGTTDNASALQALIDSQPDGTLFYFPKGRYLVKSAIHFTQGTFGLLGDLDPDCAPASILESDTPDVTVATADYGTGAGSFQIRNMEFRASNVGGTGFATGDAAEATIEDSVFRGGHIGLYQHYPFVVALRSVKFIGDLANGSHIGYLAFGPTESLVDSCDFSGWDEGARFAGAGMSIVHSTFEKNKIGLQLGLDEKGSPWIHSASSMSDLTFSDNDVGLSTEVLAGDAVSNIKIHGSANSPSGQSSVGFLADYAQQCTFSDLHVDGTFSDAAFRVTNSHRSSFLHDEIANLNAGGKVSDVAPGQPDLIQDTALLPGQVSIAGLPHTWIISKSDHVVDVTTYGVVGDSTTDNAITIQDMIDGAANGTIFHFPKGVYRVSKTLDFSRLTDFGLVGDVRAIGGSRATSMLLGEFAAPLIKVAYGSMGGKFRVRDMYLRSSDTVLASENAVDATVENVEVTGNVGLSFANPVRVALRSLNFDPQVDIRNVPLTGNNNLAIVLSGGHDNILEQVDVLGWQEGVRATGDRLTIFASRFEVNHTALNLGIAPDGTPGKLSNAAFSGVTFEANDTALNLANCQTCFFAALSGQGSSNAPTGGSVVGINIDASSNVTFSSTQMGGDFSQAGLFVSAAAQQIVFSDTGIGNSSGPGQLIQNSTTTFKN